MASRLFLSFLLAMTVSLWAQQTAPANSSSSKSAADPGSSSSTSPSSQPGDSKQPSSDSAKKTKPDLSPPRSDRVRVSDLGDDDGQSSSRDTQVDLSAPEEDARTHPQSAETVTNAELNSGGADVSEFHPWDPHRAAKDVEVGDFYFKRKNYRGAEDRYREALLYKNNDAVATFRLAVCLEKMDRPGEALQEYESYLNILPHGPQADDAKKAINRLKDPTASSNPAK